MARGRIFSDAERETIRKLDKDKDFVKANPRGVAIEKLTESRVEEVERAIRKDMMADQNLKNFFKNKQASSPPQRPETNIGELQVHKPVALFEGYLKENGIVTIRSANEYPWGIIHDDYRITIRDNKGNSWPSASHYIYASVMCYPLYAIQVRTTTEIEAMKYTASILYTNCLEKIQYDGFVLGYKKAIEANIGMQDAIINNMRGEYVWAYLNNHAILGIGVDGAGSNLLGRIITAVSMKYTPISTKPTMVMEFDDYHPWSPYTELQTSFQVDGNYFKRVIEYVYYSYFKLFLLGDIYKAYTLIQENPVDQLELIFMDLQSNYLEKKIIKATVKVLQWKFQQHVHAIRVLKTAPNVNTVSAVGFISNYVNPITNKFLRLIQSKLRNDSLIPPYKLVNINQYFFSPFIQKWVFENRLPDAIRTIDLLMKYLRIARKRRPNRGNITEVVEKPVEFELPDVDWNDLLDDGPRDDEPIAEDEVEIFGGDDDDDGEGDDVDMFDDRDEGPSAQVDGSVDWIIASIMENLYYRCGIFIPNIMFDGYPEIFFDQLTLLTTELDNHSIYYLWSYISTLIYHTNNIKGEFTVEEVLSSAMDKTPRSFDLEKMVIVIVNLLYHVESCVNTTLGTFSIGEKEYKLIQSLLGIPKPLKVKMIKESEIDENVVGLRLRLNDVFGLQNEETLNKISLEIYFLAKYMFKNQNKFERSVMSKINFYC